MVTGSIEKSKKIARETLDRLIEYVGSQARLARMLGEQGFEVSPQAVQMWCQRGRVSKKAALAITRHPELWGEFTLSQLRPEVTTEEWGRIASNLNDDLDL